MFIKHIFSFSSSSRFIVHVNWPHTGWKVFWKYIYKKSICALTGVAQLVETLSHSLKGHQFDSWSGPMTRFLSLVPSGCIWRQLSNTSLSKINKTYNSCLVFLIEFIGVRWVHQSIQVSTVQLNKTSSALGICAPITPSKVPFRPRVPPLLTSTCPLPPYPFA